MDKRISRCIELLEQDQAIYYDGPHSGHVLTHAQGRNDAGTWADYINVGMEHGAFDMAGLAEYMRGMVDAGPTRSGHRTPTVIVEAPVNGIDAAHVRYNAWQFRQILGRGVAWHPALPGGNRRRGAGLRGILPLSAQHARRRSRNPVAAGADGGAVRAKDGGTDAAGRNCSASARAAADRKPRPRRSGACRPRNTWSAAIPGRSTRTASCCSA